MDPNVRVLFTHPDKNVSLCSSLRFWPLVRPSLSLLEAGDRNTVPALAYWAWHSAMHILLGPLEHSYLFARHHTQSPFREKVCPLLFLRPEHGDAIVAHLFFALAVAVAGCGILHDPTASELAPWWPLLHASAGQNSCAALVCHFEYTRDMWLRTALRKHS